MLPDAPSAPLPPGFFPAADGLPLFERSWLPVGRPRGALVIVHGYAEHGGRYGHLADFLTRRHLGVFAYDQRGYGRSGGRRAFVSSFDAYVADLGRFIGRVRDRLDGAPLLLYGHSLGGVVAARYAAGTQDAVAGLILSSPAVELAIAPPRPVQRAAGILARFAPTLPTRHLEWTRCSRSPQVVAEAERDPLNYHGRMPIRTASELLDAGHRVAGEAERLALPLLILHGAADEVALPSGSVRLFVAAGSANKTLCLFNGLYHDLAHEPEQAHVIREIGDWIHETLDDHPAPQARAPELT